MSAAGLARLNGLDAESAERELLDGCGAWRWAREVASARPFASEVQLFESAERAFDRLEPLDWLEAFAAHPAIGAAAGDGRQSARGERFSAGEQGGLDGSDAALAAALADGNRDYLARFGWLFVVCAAGRSGAELLAELERRLGHAPEHELGVAAGEQRRITRLRLGRILER